MKKLKKAKIRRSRNVNVMRTIQRSLPRRKRKEEMKKCKKM